MYVDNDITNKSEAAKKTWNKKKTTNSIMILQQSYKFGKRRQTKANHVSNTKKIKTAQSKKNIKR